MAAVLIPNPNHFPAAPKPPRTPHEPGTTGGAPAPLLRRLRAEQPAAGQRRRRLEGLRRQRDRRSREAGGPVRYQPIGDVNGDAIDDLLLAAPGPGFSSPPDTYGQVYLIFGQPGGLPAELNLQSLDPTTGYVITGIELGDRLGANSGGGGGDINHDGIPDIVIGSDGRSPSGDRLDGGRTFVIYGGSANLAALDLADGTQDGRISLSGLDGTHGFVINGIAAPGVADSAGTLAGRASAAGDVNGDHVDDLVIGAYGGGPAKPGRVFVVFGRGPGSSAGASFPATLELASLNGSNGFVIPGLGATDSLGIAAGGGGDVNGDGIGDLVVGAQFASPSGRSLAGQAYVIFGRTSFPATFNLASLNGTNGFKVNGGAANDYLGGYTADVAGDVNGDGIDDVLIGAWGVDGPGGSTAGAAYVIFGKTTGFPAVIEVSTLNGSNGFAYGVANADPRVCRGRRRQRRRFRRHHHRVRRAPIRTESPTPARATWSTVGPSFGASLDLRPCWPRTVAMARPASSSTASSHRATRALSGDRRHQRRRLRRRPRRGPDRGSERPDRQRPSLHRLRQDLPRREPPSSTWSTTPPPTAPTSTAPPAPPSRTTP